MKNERILTCIVCPRGCTLEVELEDGAVKTVKGNICPRGESYARDECTAPKRTVTSTVRCSDGTLVAVKTDKPIPKELIFTLMKEINSACPDPELHIGDVVIKSVAGTDANVVVTSENNA